MQRYKILAIIFLIIGGSFAVINFNELTVDEIWLYDTGSKLSLEIMDSRNEAIHTMVDDIIQEYKFDMSKEVNIRLDSRIATMDPKVLALNLVNFSMPYNLSVSFNNEEFESIKKYILPIFFPKNFDAVEKEIQALENVSFRYKHYLIADLTDWYLEFPVSDARVYLSIQIKNSGQLDGYNITVVNGDGVDSLFLVAAGYNAIYLQEVINKWVLRIVCAAPFVFAVIFFGIHSRKKRAQKITPYPELEKALIRIESHLDTYCKLWSIILLAGFLLGIFAVWELAIFDDELGIIHLMIFIIISPILLFAYQSWMCNFSRIKELAREKFSSPIAPMFVAIMTFMFALMLPAVVNSDFLISLTPILLVLLCLLYILIRISNPRKEFEKVRTKIEQELKVRTENEQELKENNDHI